MAERSSKVYLHEEINIIGNRRPEYMELVTKSWAHLARTERGLRSVGVWGTLGSTGPWIQVVNLWEANGWEGMGENFRVQTSSGQMMHASLREFHKSAQELRKSGFDRLLVPSSYTPTLEEIVANRDLAGDVYYHEVFRTAPLGAQAVLDAIEGSWLERAVEHGLHLVGAYRTAMRNDSEALAIWAMKDWQAWAELESAREEPAIQAWGRKLAELGVDYTGRLMCPAPLAPVLTGQVL